MNIRVQLFAVARQIVGSEAVELQLGEGATVGDVRRALLTQAPGLEALSTHLRFAVNNAFASDDALLPPTAEVACIPPVSGG